LAGGALWIVFAAVVGAEAVHLGLGSFGAPGPGFLAFGAAVLMGTQGAALTVSGFLRAQAPVPPTEAQPNESSWVQPVITLIALFAYAALMPVLGFALASVLFIAGLLLAAPPRRWLASLLLAATAVFLSYLLFVTLLKVRMPAGILGLG